MDTQNATTATGPGSPGDARHLADQRADLLRFAAGSRHALEAIDAAMTSNLD